MKRESPPRAAAFITLEGIEGAGKSSCLPAIQSCLQEHDIAQVLTREPGGTDLAEAIRNLVLGVSGAHGLEAPTPDTEALLMFASRAQHLGAVIRPALARGDWVVCDRFTDATVAYQGGARGLGVEKIMQLADWVHADVWPDLTFLFDVSVETGSARATQRGPKDRIEQERQEFFQNVRETYLMLAAQFPERIRVIDAEQSMAEVADQVVTELVAFIEQWRSGS